MPERPIHKPGDNNGQKRQINKNSIRFKRSKQRNPLKKHQMQSIDNLIDSLAMQIASNKSKEGPW